MSSIQQIQSIMNACGVASSPTMYDSTDVFSSTSTYRTTEHDPIRLSDDVLALSCCVYRLGKDQKHYGFTSSLVKDLLTPEDQALADTIRHYYGKKLLWAHLNDQKPSKFRADLFKFIHQSDRAVYTDATSGMIHKLPDFYEEDTTLDNLRATAETSFETADQTRLMSRVLIPKAVIKRRSSRNKSNNYWLLDTATNRLCELVVQQPNPLEALWVDLFDNCATIAMTARYTHRRRENFNFYQISNWTLEKQENA